MEYYKFHENDNRPDYPKTFGAGEQANFFSMWYACRLMKAIPSLFPLKVSEKPFEVNPYDAIHGVCLLCLYHKTIQPGKGFLSTRNPQVSDAIPPQCGAYGKGDTRSTVAGTALATDRVEAMDEYYFGVLGERQRELILSTLNDPCGPVATEELVRTLTKNISKAIIDYDMILPPREMDSAQVSKETERETSF
ncbi:hypothetical protein PENSUB_2498 [Penicillium subrubescens]|uniref:Uncharacterized protein n=1 Tax=Penicillium subrubescens TaxID=1316194 RepID=A0A1Q5UHJ1_9EURO|nr:hypothetical protein PENSUB_2498 [Penicillium subrubescens]